MLKVVTGPFHPDLEQVLVETITQIKTDDPFAPLTVLVPSDHLRRRIQWLLVVEHRRALVNFEVLTFYQLALRLLDEPEAHVAAATPPTLASSFFFKELIRWLLRERTEDWPEWTALAGMPGAWAALLATVKDLKDAGVEAERAIELLVQPGFEHEVGRHHGLGRLLALYHAFLDARTRLQVMDQDDLAVRACKAVSASRFLRAQRRLLYYGFYDLTQVQLDLFQAVVRTVPTTLFFPLIPGHPAFTFAERFFERYLHGMLGAETDWQRLAPPATGRSLRALFAAAPAATGVRPTCRIITVSGLTEEVTTVAKAILALVEEQGLAFHEIGVTTRSLSGYEHVLPRVFRQHAVPFVSGLGRPLAVFPFIKAVLHLLDLRLSMLRRDLTIEFLRSPYVRLERLCPGEPAPRPDLWDLASRRLGVTRGLDEWCRLEPFVAGGLPLREDEEGLALDTRVPPEQIRAAWTAVSTLAARLESLPESAGWADLAGRLRALCMELLDPSGRGTGENHRSESDAEGLAVTLQQMFEELACLERLPGRVPLSDFVAAVHRLVEEMTVPVASEHGSGVQVLDAMAARGVPFRALFVLGMNERVFPRHIREDAFLRDRTRRLLEVDLGFKTTEKLAGYDEEQLLFFLLCNAAAEELILLYQRTDESGRVQVPSSYLDAVRRTLGAVEETAVPRQLSRRCGPGLPHRPERLTPAELTTVHLLDRRLPRRLLDALHPAGVLIARGLAALRELERAVPRLAACDGVIGDLARLWERLQRNGVSPSALEEYAVCPFRYFAGAVLRLEPMEADARDEPVGPLELGVLAHRILRRTMQTLRARGYFAEPAAFDGDPAAVLAAAAEPVFDEFARTHPVGYPLAWLLQRERLVAFLQAVLREDLAELAEGWEPVYFEHAARGWLELACGGSEGGRLALPVLGRLDRVDWSRSRNAYRIVDYKYKAGRDLGTPDRNLVLGAARGLRLQPPLYLLLGDGSLGEALPRTGGEGRPACEGVDFLYLVPRWAEAGDRALRRASFPGDAWRSPLAQPLAHALGVVLSGIRAGRFFIVPDGYCDRCDYRLVCRRTHQPTLWRARNDTALAGAHRALRRVKVEVPGGGAERGGAQASRAKPPPPRPNGREGGA